MQIYQKYKNLNFSKKSYLTRNISGSESSNSIKIRTIKFPEFEVFVRRLC